MTCPSDVARVILQILQVAVLRMRVGGWSGDGSRCAVEADHVHNLPALLLNYSDELLQFYWQVERLSFIKRCQPADLEVISEEFIAPAERERLQAQIAAALGDAGDVLGGQSSPEPDEFSIRTRIMIRVSEHESGVRILRQVLRAANVPSATWIDQAEPMVSFAVWFDETEPPLWGW